MNSNIRITPEQLKMIVEYVSKSYEANYRKGATREPHFEQVNSNGHRFKIGYIPGADGEKSLMEIKILYKGRI